MYKRKVEGSWVDKFVELGMDTESPILYYRWCGLLFVASALRRKVWIQRPRYRDYPNLYVILVSPPGLTRKSTAIDFGCSTIIPYVPAIKKFQGRITAEAIFSKLSKVDIDENNTGNIVLTSDSSLLLYESELSSLFKKLPTGTFPVIDFLTSVYSNGEEYSYETKGKGRIVLKDICINLLAATTPEGIKELIGYSGVEGGFASRTIFVYQDVRMPKPWVDDSDEYDDIIRNLIDDLNHISTISGEMVVPLNIKKHFDKWYMPQSLENSPPELIHYWNRRHDHLLKIAMLYALSERDELILSIEDFERAKTTLEEVERFMSYSFANIDKTKESRISDNVLSYILSQGGEVSHSQILRKFQHKVKNSKELKDILTGLVESDMIDIFHFTKGKGAKYSAHKG